MSNNITGQIFFRRTGKKTEDGRELFMLVGILALPKSEIEPEHQYTVIGNTLLGLPVLTICPDNIDLTDKAKGVGAGHLLTMPIWRY